MGWVQTKFFLNKSDWSSPTIHVNDSLVNMCDGEGLWYTHTHTYNLRGDRNMRQREGRTTWQEEIQSTDIFLKQLFFLFQLDTHKHTHLHFVDEEGRVSPDLRRRSSFHGRPRHLRSRLWLRVYKLWREMVTLVRKAHTIVQVTVVRGVKSARTLLNSQGNIGGRRIGEHWDGGRVNQWLPDFKTNL